MIMRLKSLNNEGQIDMAQTDFENQIALVIAALSDAGYDPHAQLTGFLQTGDETFITRRGNAREIIKTLDKDKIAQYVQRFIK